MNFSYEKHEHKLSIVSTCLHPRISNHKPSFDKLERNSKYHQILKKKSFTKTHPHSFIFNIDKPIKPKRDIKKKSIKNIRTRISLCRRRSFSNFAPFFSKGAPSAFCTQKPAVWTRTKARGCRYFGNVAKLDLQRRRIYNPLHIPCYDDPITLWGSDVRWMGKIWGFSGLFEISWDQNVGFFGSEFLWYSRFFSFVSVL